MEVEWRKGRRGGQGTDKGQGSEVAGWNTKKNGGGLDFDSRVCFSLLGSTYSGVRYYVEGKGRIFRPGRRGVGRANSTTE